MSVNVGQAGLVFSVQHILYLMSVYVTRHA